jgi:hypothetical protein
LPDKYPAKPVDISKFIKINFGPLAQYNQLKEYQQLFSNKNEDHNDIPIPVPAKLVCPLEDHTLKELPVATEDEDEDEPPPLLN